MCIYNIYIYIYIYIVCIYIYIYHIPMRCAAWTNAKGRRVVEPRCRTTDRNDNNNNNNSNNDNNKVKA